MALSDPKRCYLIRFLWMGFIGMGSVVNWELGVVRVSMDGA
jgi:hypothetical protein